MFMLSKRIMNVFSSLCEFLGGTCARLLYWGPWADPAGILLKITIRYPTYFSRSSPNYANSKWQSRVCLIYSSFRQAEYRQRTGRCKYVLGGEQETGLCRIFWRKARLVVLAALDLPIEREAWNPSNMPSWPLVRAGLDIQQSPWVILNRNK